MFLSTLCTLKLGVGVVPSLYSLEGIHSTDGYHPGGLSVGKWEQLVQEDSNLPGALWTNGPKTMTAQSRVRADGRSMMEENEAVVVGEEEEKSFIFSQPNLGVGNLSDGVLGRLLNPEKMGWIRCPQLQLQTTPAGAAKGWRGVSSGLAVVRPLVTSTLSLLYHVLSQPIHRAWNFWIGDDSLSAAGLWWPS